MFISVILDSEYMGSGERIKWFIKNLSHALDNDYLIITHEYLKTNFEKLTNNCAERFYDEFEMRHISKDELEKIDICYIPDAFFDDLYEKSGTRSKMILELTNNRFEELEKFIIDVIDRNITKRDNTNVEGIFNCLHCFKSINILGEYYNCPIIPYVFSAIRKVHGYQQTLYMANLSNDLMNNREIESLYQSFTPEDLGMDLLSNDEILCLIGKERNLPLLPLLNAEGIFEMGVAKEGYQITPQSYYVNGATDDDIYYESKKYYSSEQIISRLHPMQMDQFGLGRKNMRNDPITFILSCKRVATIQSQMIVKAMLWNRVPCVLSRALPYSFLFTNDFTENTKVSEKDLNFIIFCYFIPDSCMFSAEYWRWRKTFPSANEIMQRHLAEIIENLGYDKDILLCTENRMLRILNARGCDNCFMENILNKNIPENYDYKFLASKLRIYYKDGMFKDIFCMNETDHKRIISRFKYSNVKEIDYCVFYPLDDIAGKVKVISAEVANGKLSYCFNDEYRYYNKNQSDIKVNIELHNSDNFEIIFYWMAMNEME